MSEPARTPSQDDIAHAAEALARGDLLILPTETVYGLACDASNPRAVARVFEAKGRPRFNPMIAHVTGLEAARAIAALDARAVRLAEAFWPGPLTLVAPARGRRSGLRARPAGLDTVAVRAPDHPVAQAVLRAFGRPVAAPSANRSGRPSPTTFADAHGGDRRLRRGGAGRRAVPGGAGIHRGRRVRRPPRPAAPRRHHPGADRGHSRPAGRGRRRWRGATLARPADAPLRPPSRRCG